MCSKFGAKLQPANIERTQFVRVNAEFSIALPSLQRQFNAMFGSAFIHRLQFFILVFVLHMLQVNIVDAVYLGYLPPSALSRRMDMQTRQRRTREMGKF